MASKKRIKNETEVKKQNSESTKEIDKSPKKGLKKKENKQIMWAIILMVALILIIILVPYIKNNFINKFRYMDLDFQKTQLGDMYFYSTRIPVFDNYDRLAGSFSINFRNDPRKLEDLKVISTTTTPVFTQDRPVYISLGKFERNCVEGTAAALTLSGFLRQFAQLNVTAGISDKKLAEESNFSYITCANTPRNTVIEISEGNETRIVQTSPDCYKLEYKDCEVMQVSEKFLLMVIEGYLSQFERTDKSLLDRLR